MSTHAERLIKLVGALAVVLALAAPAAAQEWRIYLHGKVEPIVASFYAEEAPWVFYRDDESMYVFAVGCNRVERVERAGTAIPPPRCPVDRLPTTMPSVLLSIMDLEGKRLEDSVTRLREQITAYVRALVGSQVVTAELAGEARAIEAVTAGQQSQDVLAFMRSQIEDTMSDIRLTSRRLGALQDAAKGFPPRERQRYFFAPR